eukprot:CAMPEP_0119010940 /NCGR_PEP_ID=MMETSP1176-20130426/5353_1 /TAXON_ID=265551 /ORGANISM="Synedropsis recta cf, Strain CCMP1620" /LENGTH=149 /DNA_ID=CAMNT_0006963689 /DNA_START=192 /DNA_END=641 /DNA_ORIENTATION=+
MDPVVVNCTNMKNNGGARSSYSSSSYCAPENKLSEISSSNVSVKNALIQRLSHTANLLHMSSLARPAESLNFDDSLSSLQQHHPYEAAESLRRTTPNAIMTATTTNKKRTVDDAMMMMMIETPSPIVEPIHKKIRYDKDDEINKTMDLL